MMRSSALLQCEAADERHHCQASTSMKITSENSPSSDSPESSEGPDELQNPSKLGELVSLCLQSPERLQAKLRDDNLIKLGMLILFSMAIVGFLMGAFSGGAQLIAAPIKIVIGMLVAMVLCLPSLFVFSNLSGAQIDMRQAIVSMILAISVVALLLLALAPVALVFSLSTDSQALVGFIHIMLMIVGAWFGGAALNKVWNKGKSTFSMAAGIWMLLFLVVLFQLATSFRPIIGTYEELNLSDKMIFLEHWLGPLEG
jgi:hypothetical protein